MFLTKPFFEWFLESKKPLGPNGPQLAAAATYTQKLCICLEIWLVLLKCSSVALIRVTRQSEKFNEKFEKTMSL